MTYYVASAIAALATLHFVAQVGTIRVETWQSGFGLTFLFVFRAVRNATLLVAAGLLCWALARHLEPFTPFH